MRNLRFILAILFAVFFVSESILFAYQSGFENREEKRVKVGLILDGSADDKNWSEAHYIGMQKTAQDLNLKLVVKQNVVDDYTCRNIVRSMIEEGCRIIVCNSYDRLSVMRQMAYLYPKVYFYSASQYAGQHDNLCTYFGRMYELRFLSGIVAGKMTKTNEIGYVAAKRNVEVIRGINAFAMGVRMVNPNANIFVRYVDSWVDENKTSVAAQKLLTMHSIDIITMHTSTNAVLEVADRFGISSIGYNFDTMDLYENELFSITWDWAKFYEPQIEDCLNGKFTGNFFWEDVKTGLISFSDFSEEVSSEAKQLVSSSMMAFYENSNNIFTGPIYDKNGYLRVRQNSILTDEALLHQMSWLVSGVIIDD